MRLCGSALVAASLALLAARAEAGIVIPIVPQLQILSPVTGHTVDAQRVRQLFGKDSLGGFLIRTSSSMTPPPAGAGFRFQFPVLAELRVAENSALPWSMNDGVMWAGRGANVLARAGVRMQWGDHLDILLAPEFAYSANTPFEIFPGRQPGRSYYSSPWEIGVNSADIPLRFGSQPFTVLSPGQSAITVTGGPLAAGFSTENQWWGPAIDNALVMSSNAQGIPHAFVRPSRSVQTRFGSFDGQVIVGTLTKSLYFDTLAAHDYRSLSGLVVSFRPAADPDLAVGVSRVVYAPIASAGGSASHALDVLSYWHPLSAPGDTLANGQSRQKADQLASLFFRWVFPKSGVEVYGEWARTELPRSLKEFLLAPENTQGYTLGFQWARPLADSAHLLSLRSEVTDLEQSIVFADRPTPPDFYTGRAAPEGYTERGQPIGAGIGPGGSSEIVSGDYMTPGWHLGAFIERMRSYDEAMYRQTYVTFFRHDVSLIGGIRGGRTTAHADFNLELTATKRFNYLFQNGSTDPIGPPTVDVVNIGLQLSVTPH